MGTKTKTPDLFGATDEAAELAADGASSVLVETVEDVERAVSWQLRCNFYPPHPEFMVPVAVEAVLWCRSGLHDDLLALPDGVTFRGAPAVAARDIVESFRLWDLCDGGELL